ncbi:MAG: triose-phosphate isomerase [Gammaproteobacteria bacterium]|nr:triose-phosphate isomerase [Gammaproteobacteria bacterium]
MRKPLVAGNWKMNGNSASIKALLDGLLSGKAANGSAEVAVCSPFVYIPLVAEIVSGSNIAVGAQDVAVEEVGAYTGEVSGAMLKDVGCHYVLVGHSERRSLYGETDSMVAQKFAAAQRDGLVPILCVGETLDERESSMTEAVVEKQLAAVALYSGVKALNKAVIAYEPVWAIGTGMTATPEQAQAVHAFIRHWIEKQDAELAAKVRILYGGSMKGSNAAELMAQPDIDGGLVGGASLQAEEFLTICRAAG